MLIARLVRMLALLAMLIAPFGMMGSHAAAAAAPPAPMPASHGDAHAAPAAPDHCAPAGGDEGDRTQQSIDCTIFCAAMAAPGAEVAQRAAFAAIALGNRLEPIRHGLNPESEPPPPRFS